MLVIISQSMSYFIVIFAVSNSGLKIVSFGHHFLLSFHWTAASSSTMTLPSLRRPPVGLFTVSAGDLFARCLHGGWLLRSWKTFLTSCWYFCLDIPLALLVQYIQNRRIHSFSNSAHTCWSQLSLMVPTGTGLSVTNDCFLSNFSSHKLSSL